MNKILETKNTLSSYTAIEREHTRLSNLGSIVKSFRSRRGISRNILAKKSGISLRYLAQLESGNANPTITILKNISHALNITLSDLIFVSDKKTSNLNFFENKLNKFSSLQIKKITDLINQFHKENNLKKNKNKIALIGLRGAGKSTLGSMYKEEFRYPIFEISHEIEKIAGMNMNEIIELGGQGMYRRLEYDTIQTLYKKNKKLLILTGGSVVSEKETYSFVLNNFYTIWIKASPKEHMERVIKQGDLRPMGSNPRAMEDLNNILKERMDLYYKADHIVDTENKTIDESYKLFKLKIEPLID